MMRLVVLQVGVPPVSPPTVTHPLTLSTRLINPLSYTPYNHILFISSSGGGASSGTTRSDTHTTHPKNPTLLTQTLTHTIHPSTVTHFPCISSCGGACSGTTRSDTHTTHPMNPTLSTQTLTHTIHPSTVTFPVFS